MNTHIHEAPRDAAARELRAAEALAAGGNVAEAVVRLTQLSTGFSYFHPGHHALGLLLVQQGKLPAALQHFATAVRLSPDTGMYHRNLGEVCRRLNQLPEAIAEGRRACELMPSDSEAHYNLGLALTDNGTYKAAIESYRRGLAVRPGHGRCWNNLGAALERDGDPEAALECYLQAVTIDANHVEAQNNLGVLYSELGQIDAAILRLRTAIRLDPEFIEARFNLATLKRFTADDPEWAALEMRIPDSVHMTPAIRARFWFALGKAREDVGHYDEAFAAYAAGNRTQQPLSPYDERSDEQLTSHIRIVFTHEVCTRDKPARSPASAPTPIFIVGMPRSGTTLIEQIIASHSNVHGAGELPDLDAVIGEAARARGCPFPDLAAQLSAEEFLALGATYRARLAALAPKAQFVVDKMPANFFYLGMIHRMLPDAKIVHAMRDPMDSCFSCYTRLFTRGLGFTYDFGTLGRYYGRYAALMQHWRDVLPPDRIFDLSYEMLVANFEREARRLLAYVGLPWDDRCLHFYRTVRRVRTASLAQVRQPISQSSVARWEKFHTHVSPLLEAVGPLRPIPPMPPMPPMH